MRSPARILVATDLSVPSRHSVDRAFRIAVAAGASVDVIHVQELDALDSLLGLLGKDLPSVKRKLEEQAGDALRKMVADPARNLGISAQARVLAGDPLVKILDEADGIDADLLVVGAHGESSLRHALLGSTASRLLRKSVRRPVLVVKQASHEPYRRLLVPVDFSPASHQALRLARQIAPGAELVLLHVFELPFEGKLSLAGVDEEAIRDYVRSAGTVHQRQLDQLAADAGLNADDYVAVVAHGDPSLQIIAQEQDCDLVVLGKHGTHLLEDLLLGGVTAHVLSESQGDVLVISDSRRAPDEPLGA